MAPFFSSSPRLVYLVLTAAAAVPTADAFGAATPGGPPTWSDLERRLPSSLVPEPAVYDATTAGDGDGIDESTLAGKLVLYRDRNGWCPYAERAWLALEVKRADYVTILVDDKYDTPGGSLPRVRWPDGTVHEGNADIYALLERVQEEFPNPPDFYPDISISVDIVRASIERRFDGVLPRYTRPSCLAPYVYRSDPEAGEDEIVPRFKYQVTLEEIDEILEEYDDGPFIAGEHVTAADVYWAPFLERFASHLPLLHGGLEPRSRDYEAVRDWYDAMDALVPCYPCRVKGLVGTWRHVLGTAHPDLLALGDDGADPPPVVVPDLPTRRSFDSGKVWSRYAEGRPYLAETPSGQVGAHVVRNRDDIVRRTAAACDALGDDDSAVDAALREVCDALVELGGGAGGDAGEVASKLSGDARDVASFLSGVDGLAVPRDLGAIPALALRALVDAAPKPRI